MTVQVRGRQGRKGNREWELRSRLTRSAAWMHAKHLDPMVDDLHALLLGSGHRSWLPGTPRKTCWTYSPWPAVTRIGPPSGPGSPGSTNDALPPACRNWSGWPTRSRCGGPKSSRSSRPVSPTRDPKVDHDPRAFDPVNGKSGGEQGLGWQDWRRDRSGVPESDRLPAQVVACVNDGRQRQP